MDNRVAFLVSTISNGGAEAVAVNVASGLADAGLDVDLVVLGNKDNSYVGRLSPNVNLVDLGVERARYAAPALIRYIKDRNPQKLVIFKYELIDLIVIIKRTFRFRFRVIGRNITIYGEKGGSQSSVLKKIVRLIFGEPIEQLDFIINQSNLMERDLLYQFPCLKSKSIVIYNPVAEYIEKYSKNRDLAPIEVDRYILCVGRLEKVKAFHHAIKAFSVIAEKDQGLGLKLVGDGSLKDDLMLQVEELDLEDRVDFVGFQENLIPFYENASMTLLTSNHEGFPNVLIESIVLGTPVVSFDCPSGPREILEYGKYGKLVPPGDVQGLASAIDEVLKNPSQFNLRERAEAFSRKIAIDKYLKLLGEV